MLIPPRRVPGTGPELLVFDLRNVPSHRCWLGELHGCNFLFPRMKQDVRLDSAEIQTNAACAWGRSRGPTPFRLDARHRISTIIFYCGKGLTKQDTYLFVIPHETLLSHTHRAAGLGYSVHWFLWGVLGTRAFRLPAIHNSSFSNFRSSYGMRFVDVSRPRPNQRSIHLFVADFNQKPIRKAMACEEWSNPPPRGDAPKKMKIVLDETVIEPTEKSPFDVHVSTSLPYRYGTITLPDEDFARPSFVFAQMEEDGIVISRYSSENVNFGELVGSILFASSWLPLTGGTL